MGSIRFDIFFSTLLESMELDSAVVERRGWCWAMTSFGVDAYKASEKNLLAEGVTIHNPSEEET